MNCTLLLSGGLDSTVLLAWIRNKTKVGYVHAVSVYYGQKHWREIQHAFQIAHYYGASYERIDLDPIILHGSALTGEGEIPKGVHYTDNKQKSTVVPGRNLVLLSLAVSAAIKRTHQRVYFAAHSGDAAIYPDCRGNFVRDLNMTVKETYNIEIHAPFVGMTKKEVVSIGRELQVPFEMTWSCYEGGTNPCGQCGACIERNEALVST